MFRDSIYTTPFTTEAANAALSRISAYSYASDVSFAATLRALLGSRLPENEQIYLDLTRNGASANASELVHDVASEMRRRSADILIVQSALLDNAWENFPSEFVTSNPGWEHVQKMTLRYKTLGSVYLFRNAEKKRAIIVTDRIDKLRWHAFQVAIPVMLPWFFQGDNALTEEELALITALNTDETPDNYLEILGRIAASYDFREAAIRRCLSGFEAAAHEQQKRKVEDELECLREEMARFLSRYREDLKKYNERNVYLTGLDLAIQKTAGSSALMDYFLSAKNLDIVQCEDGVLTFTVKGELMYWDEASAEVAIRNHDSVFYRRIGDDTPCEDAELVYRAIFLDQTVRLRMCGAYRIGTECGMQTADGFDFGYGFSEYLPNPHIQHFGCSGDNIAAANECVERGNYIGAVEQCIYSCANLSVTDSVVMKQLGEDLFVRDYKCLELPDGRIVTASEAVTALRGE